MRPTRLSFGSDAVDALVTDQYLEALLASAERTPAQDEADADHDPAADPALARAGEVVRASLVRVHPSFRFEERLADRLAELAASGAARAVAAGGARGDVIPFPGALAVAGGIEDPLLADVLDGRLDPTDAEAVARAAGLRAPARPLIVGGAITSAAISIVGVAIVAWRASRPGAAPMGRAARAAHARRPADLAAGIPGGPV